MAVKFTILGSGSSGNCTYVETDDGSSLTLSIVGVTKMACGEEAMKAETDWLALAAKVRSFVLEDDELLLVDEARIAIDRRMARTINVKGVAA